jgi:hypothetical protein
MAVQPPPKPLAVEARLADLCKVRSLISVRRCWISGVRESYGSVGRAFVQELGADEALASEAAALLEQGKGALLASPSFASKSVRPAAPLWF